MPPYGKYLISGISANLTLYYLITISIFVISISTALTVLINLSRYLINSLFTSDLFDSRIEIIFFFEYDIFIVFIDCGTSSSRLIFIFNSSIRSFFDILFAFSCLVNMSLFETSVFLSLFFLSAVFSFELLSINLFSIYPIVRLLPLRSSRVFWVRLTSYLYSFLYFYILIRP